MFTDTEPEAKKPVHLGRNVQRIREIIGMKQIVLAENTGMSQQNISKLEQSENIPDETLDKIAKGLGVTSEVIKNFNEEKAVYNIQSNFNNYDHSQQNFQPVFNNNSPVDKVVELFEKLLQSEREKVELLSSANKAILELSEQLKAMKK